jgi:DNA polymerase-3 subunit epsilon
VRQRLYDYLLERPGGATPDELLALVFTGPGRDPEFGPRFITALLGADARFSYAPAEQRWRARRYEPLASALASTEFVVLDLETTGGAPGSGAIIDVGAVRVRDGRLGESFESLVNPRRPIPPFVAHLTGIDDASVAAAPGIERALPRLRAFIGEAVVVAHNAVHDLAHLNCAAQALGADEIDAPTLCTMRLTRHFEPGLRRRGLDAVAAALGIATFGRHRGLGDARITAEILTVWLERAAERGITRLDELLALQDTASDGRPFVVHVPRARLRAVPPVPGVYHLLGADGRVLYVGKARRLRERLASYFTNARGHRRRTLELVRNTHDFAVTETGSELAASLLEARRIRELKPPYNRQRRQLPRVGFLKLNVRNAFPRLWVTQRLGADRAVYLGPFPSVTAAERAHRVLARLFGLRTCPGSLTPASDASPCTEGQIGHCPAPCAARLDAAAYRRGVDACLALLDGSDDGPLEALHARRDALAERECFEAAERVQRDVEVLDDIRRRRRTLGWIVGRQNFVVLLPTEERRVAHLYAVLGGRLAFEQEVAADADVPAALRRVRESFARYQGAPLARGDVEASTILAAWLRDRGREGIVLPFDTPDALNDQLDGLVVTLGDLRQRGPLPEIEGLR